MLTFLGNIILSGPAIILILLYQLLLNKFGLSGYLALGADGHGGRTGLLDSNREGIVSCAGYLSLYLLAVELGKHIFNRERFHTNVTVHVVLIGRSLLKSFYCEIARTMFFLCGQHNFLMNK